MRDIFVLTTSFITLLIFTMRRFLLKITMRIGLLIIFAFTAAKILKCVVLTFVMFSKVIFSK